MSVLRGKGMGWGNKGMRIWDRQRNDLPEVKGYIRVCEKYLSFFNMAELSAFLYFFNDLKNKVLREIYLN